MRPFAKCIHVFLCVLGPGFAFKSMDAFKVTLEGANGIHARVEKTQEESDPVATKSKAIQARLPRLSVASSLFRVGTLVTVEDTDRLFAIDKIKDDGDNKKRIRLRDELNNVYAWYTPRQLHSVPPHFRCSVKLDDGDDGDGDDDNEDGDDDDDGNNEGEEEEEDKKTWQAHKASIPNFQFYSEKERERAEEEWLQTEAERKKQEERSEVESAGSKNERCRKGDIVLIKGKQLFKRWKAKVAFGIVTRMRRLRSDGTWTSVEVRKCVGSACKDDEEKCSACISTKCKTKCGISGYSAKKAKKLFRVEKDKMHGGEEWNEMVDAEIRKHSDVDEIVQKQRQEQEERLEISSPLANELAQAVESRRKLMLAQQKEIPPAPTDIGF